MLRLLLCVALLAAIGLLAYRLRAGSRSPTGRTQTAAVRKTLEALRSAEEPEPPGPEREAELPEADPQPPSPRGDAPIEPAKDEERRKYPRFPTDQQISIIPFAGKGRLASGCDVSLGGIRFEAMGCPALAGDLLRLSFNIGEETVEAIGRVVRRTKLDPITVELAVEFVRIDPWAARLLIREMESEA